MKLVHVTADGREITIGLRSEGWYAGYTSAFLKTPHAYSVRTCDSLQDRLNSGRGLLPLPGGERGNAAAFSLGALR